MSLLIIGGTGTLGRQIVLQSLTKGYQVRGLVLNFLTASFLKDTSLLAILIIVVTIMMLFVYTFLNYQKGRRNNRDIRP